MRFKQNLPLLVVLLSAAAVIAAVVYLSPSDDDRLRAAVAEHVTSIPDVVEWVVHPDHVADVGLKDGRVLRLLFEKRGDAWAFAIDLNKEFVEAVQRPELHREVGERLGRRLQARFGGNVGVKAGMEYAYGLERDPDGLLGTMTLRFAYGDSGLGGLYVERFRREHGKWTSQGTGSLFDAAPTAAPPPK